MITLIIRIFLAVSIIAVPITQGAIGQPMTPSSTFKGRADCSLNMALSKISCDDNNCLDKNCSLSAFTFSTLFVKNSYSLLNNGGSESFPDGHSDKVPSQVPIPIYRPPIA